MAINLQKGQKINLSKERAGLSRVMVGLGWQEAQQSGGFLSMFKAKPEEIDCDAFAIMLGSDGSFLTIRQILKIVPYSLIICGGGMAQSNTWAMILSAAVVEIMSKSK